jgi:hypothetical protein
MTPPRFMVRWAPSDYSIAGDWQVYDTTGKRGVVANLAVPHHASEAHRDFLEGLACDWAARLNQHPEDA